MYVSTADSNMDSCFLPATPLFHALLRATDPPNDTDGWHCLFCAAACPALRDIDGQVTG